MSAQADRRRPYVRPMSGWWRRDPYYVRYMVMEATSILIALYAVILLVGVLRLSQGEAAYEGWVEALRSPWSVALHVLLLAVFIYHTWSWFRIMPKTLPALHVGGARVSQRAITWTGVAVAVVLNLGVLVLLAAVGP